MNIDLLNEKPFITKYELVEFFGLSFPTVNRLMYEGEIEFIKYSTGVVRFDSNDVKEMIKSIKK